MGSKKVRKMVCENKITVDLKTVSPTDFLPKFFAKVKEKDQALGPSALIGNKAAIHRHLTCALLSRNINILHDNEFMSANMATKCLKRKPNYLRKKTMRNQNANHLFSQERDMRKLNRYFMEMQNLEGV